MLTLDTNAVIYYLKDDADAVELLEPLIRTRTPLFIATITELELFSLPTITAEESNRIEAVLPLFSIFPLDSRIARKAAEIRRMYRLKIADSIIAATALFTHTPVVTRNQQDFKRVSNLRIVSL